LLSKVWVAAAAVGAAIIVAVIGDLSVKGGYAIEPDSIVLDILDVEKLLGLSGE
jgi:hypothetical protein